MNEFEFCVLSESDNIILNNNVFDNYNKVRNDNGYNEELNDKIKNEIESILNGLLLTENDYIKEKEKNEKLQEKLNKLLEDYNKEKEVNAILVEQNNKLFESYNNIKYKLIKKRKLID